MADGHSAREWFPIRPLCVCQLILSPPFVLHTAVPSYILTGGQFYLSSLDTSEWHLEDDGSSDCLGCSCSLRGDLTDESCIGSTKLTAEIVILVVPSRTG